MNVTPVSFAFTAPRLGVLWASARRFPFAAAAAAAFAVLMISTNHDWFKDDITAPVAYGLFASFFACLAIGLTAEARDWPRERLWLASSLALIMMVLWVYGLGPDIGLPHILLGFSLLGWCMITPHLGKAGDDEVWVFNQQGFYGLGIGALAAFLFNLGIGAVLWAFSQLFGSSGNKLWLDAGVLIYALFWPLYAITFLPRLPLRLAGTPGYPAPLSFVLTFVALPVLLLFGAVVAVYGVRIMVMGHAPMGSVSWMVMGFAAAGTALHFLLYPLRDAGGRLVSFYYRYFYYLLIPLLGLLFWAVAIRIHAYGITEYRYLAVLGGFWASGLSLAWLWRGRYRIWLPPATLAILLLLASFGPWGAEQVAFYSQERRLAVVLEEAGLYRDGRWRDTPPPGANWEQRRNLSGLLDYFHDRRDKRLPALLEELRDLRNDNLGYESWPQLVMRHWHLGYVDKYSQRRENDNTSPTERMRYQAGSIFQNRQAIKVAGYDYLLPFQVHRQGEPFTWQGIPLTLSLNADSLVFEQGHGQGEAGRLPLLPLLQAELLQPESFRNGPALEAEVAITNGQAHGSSRAFIESVELERSNNGEWQILNVSGHVFWRPLGNQP